MLIFKRKRLHFAMCWNDGGDGAGAGSDGNAGNEGGGGGGRSNFANGGAGSDGNAGNEGGSAFALPDAYKDKGYLKGVKSVDDVYKMLDNAQTMLGKRAVPEYGKATDEDWEGFFSKTRPADGKYTLNEQGIFEGLRGNEEFSKGLSGLFNKAGLTQKQVDLLMDPKDGYPGLTMSQIQKMNGQIQQQEQQKDADFDTRLTTLMGSRKDEGLANALKLRDELGLKDELNDLDPEQLASLAFVFDKIYTEYIANDTLNKRDGGGAGNKNQITQATLDAYKQKHWDVYTNPAHNQYGEVMKTVNDMTKAIMKSTNW